MCFDISSILVDRVAVVDLVCCCGGSWCVIDNIEVPSFGRFII